MHFHAAEDRRKWHVAINVEAAKVHIRFSTTLKKRRRRGAGGGGAGAGAGGA